MRFRGGLRQKLSFGILILSLALVFHRDARGDHELVINTAAQPPMVNAQHTGFLDELTKEIFSRMGHKVKIVLMKANARTLVNVDKGIDDGNLVRIKGMERIFKNMRMVPENMTSFEFVAFSKKPGIRIEKWDDLEPYNVAFIRGWKILERNVKKAQSINLVKDAGQLFDLLKNDRADVVVFGPLRGRYVLEKKGISGVKVHSPPLATQKVYMYLNKKHQALIPAATAALRDMKRDGTYSVLFKATVGPYVSADEEKRLLAR